MQIYYSLSIPHADLVESFHAPQHSFELIAPHFLYFTFHAPDFLLLTLHSNRLVSDL